MKVNETLKTRVDSSSVIFSSEFTKYKVEFKVCNKMLIGFVT